MSIYKPPNAIIDLDGGIATKAAGFDREIDARHFFVTVAHMPRTYIENYNKLKKGIKDKLIYSPFAEAMITRFQDEDPRFYNQQVYSHDLKDEYKAFVNAMEALKKPQWIVWWYERPKKVKHRYTRESVIDKKLREK